MPGQKMDGIEVSNAVKEILKSAVEKLDSEGMIPCLATILVGDDPASATYVKNKHTACKKIGIKTKDHKLPTDTTQKKLDEVIDSLNNDKEVHGILVQLPLPKQLNEFATISRISPIKDVDGLTPQNVGLLSIGKSILRPCTPSGIMELFYYYKINLEGKNVVMINRSNLIGKPLYHLLLQNNATVITCHSKTRNLAEYCKNADIIITAVGNREKFKLTSDMIKQDAIVIDVAISRYGGKLTGDTDYDDIIQKASRVTPVPGGVGPMTVAMLLKNTVTAASLSKEIVG
jgi:methylenetetrahydrofolate dehydrogenase (NADP+)/methenyltetrahydrofolate cyclohydrolase|tara:strand:- start:914 stop:1777 length:864 start_codon:yes stop_codon:yes gene_type:complete